MGLVYLMFCGKSCFHPTVSQAEMWTGVFLNSCFGLHVQKSSEMKLILIVFLISAFSFLFRSDPQALNDFLHGTNEVTKES